MEGVAQASIEVRVLGKIVGTEDDVDEPLVDRVVEAFDEAAAVAGHAAESNLSLAFGAFREFPPFGVLHAFDVVDRVVEVDIEIVRSEALQAALQGLHHVGLPMAGPGLGL